MPAALPVTTGAAVRILGRVETPNELAATLTLEAIEARFRRSEEMLEELLGIVRGLAGVPELLERYRPLLEEGERRLTKRKIGRRREVRYGAEGEGD